MHLSFKKQFVQYSIICYSFLFHSWSYKLEIKWSELRKFVLSAPIILSWTWEKE